MTERTKIPYCQRHVSINYKPPKAAVAFAKVEGDRQGYRVCQACLDRMIAGAGLRGKKITIQYHTNHNNEGATP